MAKPRVERSTETRFGEFIFQSPEKSFNRFPFLSTVVKNLPPPRRTKSLDKNAKDYQSSNQHESSFLLEDKTEILPSLSSINLLSCFVCFPGLFLCAKKPDTQTLLALSLHLRIAHRSLTSSSLANLFSNNSP